MHYGIVAIGSRGDVQPYVALAIGLMTRGHEATVMAHENFKDFVEGYGVNFHSLDGSVEDLLHREDAKSVLKSGSFFGFARFLQKNVRETQEVVSQDVLAGSLKVDVFVSSLLAVPWIHAIAEKQHKKWAIVQLNLPAVPTREFPLAVMDYVDFPGYNIFTYRLFEHAYWQANKKTNNDFRIKVGLPPLKTPIIRKIRDEKIPNLHAFSPALRARPADWDSNVDITGFLFLPAKERALNLQENSSDALVRWLGAGDPPIYIGFGSIPIPDPERFKSIVIELLKKTSHRYLFCQGWSLAIDLPEDPRLFVVKSVNHEWLFPRCQAAIIHGGVGTTAAVLRAKIPVIILSIIADQPWWGKIIERKRVGVHIPFRKLTIHKLLAAIEKIGDIQIKSNASSLGEQINREDGLKKTIEALEKFFSTL